MVEPGYREDVLMDIARVSGGVFRTHDQIDRLNDGIPLSRSIPSRIARRYPSQTPWYVGFLVAVMCLEWFARRRIGLK